MLECIIVDYCSTSMHMPYDSRAHEDQFTCSSNTTRHDIDVLCTAVGRIREENTTVGLCTRNKEGTEYILQYKYAVCTYSEYNVSSQKEDGIHVMAKFSHELCCSNPLSQLLLYQELEAQ